MTQVTIPRETIEQALRRAYHLGQTYWQQADSDSYSQNAKAAVTQANFNLLVEDTLAAALASAEPAGWQPIETKPPAMEPVLMWDWKHVFIEQWWGPEFHLDKRITHWMPLPEAPKGNV